MEDWALCMIDVKDGKVRWTREEALASISNHDIIDLPSNIADLISQPTPGFATLERLISYIDQNLVHLGLHLT